jgi:hypothetical protein
MPRLSARRSASTPAMVARSSLGTAAFGGRACGGQTGVQHLLRQGAALWRAPGSSEANTRPETEEQQGALRFEIEPRGAMPAGAASWGKNATPPPADGAGYHPSPAPPGLGVVAEALALAALLKLVHRVEADGACKTDIQVHGVGWGSGRCGGAAAHAGQKRGWAGRAEVVTGRLQNICIGSH